MAHSQQNNPFVTGSALSKEQLVRYARGVSDSSEQYRVEHAMESEPLLREALAGLQHPGAIEGWEQLGRDMPTRNAPGWPPYLLVCSLLVVVITATQVIAPPTSSLAQPTQDSTVAPTKETLTAQPQAEPTWTGLSTARELPAAEQIGHARTERHSSPRTQQEAIQRSVDITRVPVRTPDSSTITEVQAASPARAGRPSRQLMYLHDLKVVHPQELYAHDPLLLIDLGGLDARYADREQRRTEAVEPIEVPYTKYLSVTMARFVSNDHRACLEDLRVVLSLYPEDVNALFYAGLCSYNLGLYEQAKVLLMSAATHPVEVFDEEADWYHALTLERLGDSTGSQHALGRIAKAGGYYAEAATQRIASR